LTCTSDDGIVVGVTKMPRTMTLADYLAGEETLRPRELAYGILREPPAPGFRHQLLVGRLHLCLERHVRRRAAGRLVLSPVDVILDRKNALVVQPDLVFVAEPHRHVSGDRMWGAPDLVVEVLSASTRHHDRTVKLGWYRRYGVRECWLVDPDAYEITVVDLTHETIPPRIFTRRERLRSAVLPRLRLPLAEVFNDD
jgi:Uma2 family endonuclease